MDYMMRNFIQICRLSSYTYSHHHLHASSSTVLKYSCSNLRCKWASPSTLFLTPLVRIFQKVCILQPRCQNVDFDSKISQPKSNWQIDKLLQIQTSSWMCLCHHLQTLFPHSILAALLEEWYYLEYVEPATSPRDELHGCQTSSLKIYKIKC